MFNLNKKFLFLFLILIFIFSFTGCDKENSNIKTMTFNIKFDSNKDPFSWKERKEVAFNIIKKSNPDLIGLQEVTGKMMIDIKEEFSNQYYIYGVPRSDKENDEMTPILINKNRFEIIKKDTLWLSETPKKKGTIGWDASLPRVASFALIKDKNNKNNLLMFLNTHYDHKGIYATINSSNILKNIIETNTKKNISTIVTGDFNSQPNMSEIITLLKIKGVNSSYNVMKNNNQTDLFTTHDFKGNDKDEYIDYIFSSQNLYIKNTEIIKENINGIYPSDHYPVISTIKYNN